MVNSLYDISTALEAKIYIDEETGELDEELLNSLEMQFDDKAENIACYIKNLVADAEKLRAEEKTLCERRQAKEKKAAKLNSYLLAMMTRTNRTKLEFTRAIISTRKSNVVKTDNDFVEWAKKNADDLLTYKEPTPNKTAIKEAIKNGIAVEHATIAENITAQIK